jgi:hypothetical protein
VGVRAAPPFTAQQVLIKTIEVVYTANADNRPPAVTSPLLAPGTLETPARTAPLFRSPSGRP